MGETSAPLLETKKRVYCEDCPGCKQDRKNENNPGIPYREFLYIWIVTLCSGLPISSLFPFLYFMAYATEVCRKEYQALGISLVSTSRGIGMILGPAIGGFLAQIFSLWAVSSKKYGGLSFSSGDVGEVLAISGFSLLLYQLFLYAPFVKAVGPIIATRISAVLMIPLLVGYPYMVYLSGVTLKLVVYCASILKYIFSMTIITGLNILQNNSVSQHQRGAANGISVTAMSFFKTIAPAGGGAM